MAKGAFTGYVLVYKHAVATLRPHVSSEARVPRVAIPQANLLCLGI